MKRRGVLEMALLLDEGVEAKSTERASRATEGEAVRPIVRSGGQDGGHGEQWDRCDGWRSM
jgi:hypothetical protein